MPRTSSFLIKSILWLGVCLSLAASLFGQSMPVSISGTLGPVISAGVSGGNYQSGITATGTAGQTCNLAFISSNGQGSGGTASVALTDTNSIAQNAVLKILTPGGGYTALPTSATVSTGTATSCTGTAVVTTVWDPLSLNGQTFTATTSLPALGVVYSPSFETYTLPTLSITAEGLPLQCTNATAQVSTSSTFDDTLSLSNCNLSLGTIHGSFTSSISFPPNSVIAPIPLAFSAGILTSPDTISAGTYTIANDSTELGISGVITAGPCSGCPSLSLTYPGSPGKLSFAATVGNGTPAPQTVTVNTGNNEAYAVTSSASWLTLSTTGGQTNGGTFNVGVNLTGLAPNTYNGSVSVYSAASNSPQVVQVQLVLSPPTFSLVPSPTSFTFNSVNSSSPSSQNLSVDTNPTGLGVQYTAAPSSTGNWLSVTPTQGTTGGTPLAVSVTPGLSPNTYTGSIALSATNSTNSPTLPVTFNVTSIPTPANLNFSYVTGGAAPPNQTLNVTATGPNVTYTAAVTSGGAWLSVSSGTFTTNGAGPTVSIINYTGLSANTYNGTIAITPAGGAPINVGVTLTVTSVPAMVAAPVSLSFTSNAGSQPASQPLSITSSGGAAQPITYTASAVTTSGGSWLQISSSGGATPGSETVSIVTSVLSGLPTGTYNGAVLFTCNPTSSCTNTNGATSGQLSVPVTLTVSAALSPNPTSLTFTYITGGTVPGALPVAVTSNGAAITYTATPATTSGGGWLAVSPGSNTTPNGVSVSLNAGVVTGLAPNTYQGTITLASAGATNSPVTIPVTLNVIALSVTGGPLSFSMVDLGSLPAAKNLSVTATGNAQIPFTTSVSTQAGSGNWLAATAGGTTPANVSVSILANSLAPNTYTGQVAITATGTTDTVTVNVTLVVTSAPNISANPGSLTYNYTLLSGSNPASQPVSVTASGGAAIPFTAAPSTTSGGPWLSVTSNSNNTPATLTVSVSPAGLAAGTYTGSISLTSAQAANSPQTIGVTFTVNPAPNLGTSSQSLAFAYQVSGSNPVSQPLTVTSNGAALNFTAAPSTTSGGGWLAVSPTSGTTGQASANLSVSIVPSVLATLTPNTYNGSITITSGQAGNSPVTVGVTLTVSAQPSLTTKPSSLSFSYTLNGSVPGSQQVTVGTTDNSTPTISAGANTPWLSVQQSGLTLTVSLVSSQIPTTPGPYSGSITITAAGYSNSPLTYPVSLTVSAQPVLSVAPSSLTFNAQTGGSNPAAQPLGITSTGGSVSFTAAVMTGGGWLSLDSKSGNTPATLHASVNIAGLLASGSPYSGSIMVTASGASGSPVTIPVTLNLAANSLTANPSPLNFTWQLGGAAPAAQALNVGSTIPGLSFTATPGANWVQISPGSGTTPASPSVSITTTGLTVGPYNSTIQITSAGAANSPLSVPVNLTVTAPPALTAQPASLSFSYSVGASTPASQPVQIAAGSNVVSFTTSVATTSGGSWLAATPSGTTPQSINVSLMNLGSLTPNTYHGSVTVTAPGNDTVTIPVTLTVSAMPLLTANPTSLSFSYILGAAAPMGQSVAVSTSNGASAAFSVSASTTSGGPWLQVSPTNGASPASFIASIATAGLTAGNYTGSIVISATGFTSQTVTVSLAVTAPKAVIQVTGSTTFSLPNTAQSTTSVLAIASSDGSAQPFTITLTPNNWLTLSPASGTTPANVTLKVTPTGLTPGVYVAPLTVTMPNLPVSTKVIQLQLTVTGSTLAATPAILSFTYQPGAPLPPPQSVALSVASGSSSVPLAAVTTDVQWLNVTTAADAPATLQVSLNPGNTALLKPGTYTGAVLVRIAASQYVSLQIPVTLTVNPLPQLTATPSTLAFTYQIGGAAPAPQSFALATGNTTANFTATSPASWLQLSPTHGSTPASVLVTANPTGLAAGTYSGTIAVTTLGVASSVSIPVTLTVTAPTQLAITPGTLSFSVPVVGGPAPAPQTLSVTSTGPALGFTAAAGTYWLHVTPASGTTPASLSVSVNPAGLQAGSYSGTVNVTPAGSAVAQVIIVTLQVGPSSQNHQVTIQGVINAASGAVGKVSPGMAISIFGSSLGPQTAAVFTAPPQGGTVATTLGGTQVLFDGTPAPLLFSWDGQVNALVPFELSGKSSTVLTVVYSGETSAGVTLPVVAAEPGLFTANSSGTGQGAILNQDSSVNSASNPAAVGSVIQLFGTGGGLTLPPSTDGALNPVTSTGALVLPVTATIGGQTADVQYAGPAPGLVSGIIQINLTIPNGTPSGNVPVVVQVGTAGSQSNVTVAVQ